MRQQTWVETVATFPDFMGSERPHEQWKSMFRFLLDLQQKHDI